MDEAERCHEIAYIAYGELLAHGTGGRGRCRQSNLTTYSVTGEGLVQLALELEKKPGVDSVAPFGTSLHVSGHDRAALEAAIAPYRNDPKLIWKEIEPSLEDVFIGLMAQAKDNCHERVLGPVRSGFWRRVGAMIRKEFVQLRRDRITFATIVTIPLMQLVLFGYAINTQPRDLPTAVLLQESSDVGRSILKALENTKYFKITRQVRDEAEFDRVLAAGEVLFAIEIPRGFERALRRGDKPALLVAADATDPVATGVGARRAQQPRDRRRSRNDRAIPDSGAAAVRDPHPRPLQPGGLEPAQHRAGSDGHDPDDDHADLHGAVGHARDRARHHGEPAVDADHAARDHARQDHPLCADRVSARRALIIGAGVVLFDVPIIGSLTLLGAAHRRCSSRPISRSVTRSRRSRRTSFRRSRWR